MTLPIPLQEKINAQEGKKQTGSKKKTRATSSAMCNLCFTATFLHVPWIDNYIAITRIRRMHITRR